MGKTYKNTSSVLRWAISLCEQLESEKLYIQRDYEQTARVNARLLAGYTVCTYFAEKVCSYIQLYVPHAFQLALCSWPSRVTFPT